VVTIAGSVISMRLQAAIDFAGHGRLAIADHDLGSEGRLRPAEERRQHLAGLVRIIVDRLLAEDDELRCFLLCHRREQLGHRQRLQFDVALDQDGAIGADGHRGAQRFLAGGDATGNGDHFGRLAPSLSRIASSTAISSKGFIDIFTFARSTPVPSALTRTLTL
jgi:hypothetical protein